MSQASIDSTPQSLLADLPRSAMPHTPWGVAAWARAERLFNQGRWGDAKDAYLVAEQADCRV